MTVFLGSKSKPAGQVREYRGYKHVSHLLKDWLDKKLDTMHNETQLKNIVNNVYFDDVLIKDMQVYPPFRPLSYTQLFFSIEFSKTPEFENVFDWDIC